MFNVVTPGSGTASVSVTVGSGGSISMHVHASYVDNNGGTFTPGTQNTVIASTAATTVVSQNASAGVQRNVKTLQIYNNGSAANLVTVSHTDGTTSVTIKQATLQIGETLSYNEGSEWQHCDVSGNVLGTYTALVKTLGTPIPGFLSGLRLSVPVPAGGRVITVGAGQATSSDGTTSMVLSSTYTKGSDAAWAVGSGNGSLDVTPVNTGAYYHAYLIERTDTGVVDILTSQAPDQSSTVTITNASPGVVTWNNHGLQGECPIVFSTTGTLPTGLTAGTQYYVVNAAQNTFQVTATPTGTAINTSSAGSGTHTCTAAPIMPTNYTKRRRFSSAIQMLGGGNMLPLVCEGDNVYFGLNSPGNFTTSATPSVVSTFAVGGSTVGNVPGGLPLGQIVVLLTGFANSATAHTQVYISGEQTGTGISAPSLTTEGTTSTGASSVGDNSQFSVEVPIGPGANAYCRATAATTVSWNVVGYRDNRGQNL